MLSKFNSLSKYLKMYQNKKHLRYSVHVSLCSAYRPLWSLPHQVVKNNGTTVDVVSLGSLHVSRLRVIATKIPHSLRVVADVKVMEKLQMVVVKQC